MVLAVGAHISRGGHPVGHVIESGYGGDIPGFFGRYRMQLKSRADIQNVSGLSAEDIRQWITHPTEAAAKAKSTKKPPMPAKYGKLPAADLDALVAYMASLK